MTCKPSAIIKKSALNERLRYSDGETKDIIKVIMDMDARSDKYVDADAVECLRGSDDYETMRNVWKFVKSNIRYSADKRGREVVKSPAALFAIGRGDCKSFSIAEVAILRALGFKSLKYRFTAYKNSSDVTHVYVIAKLRGQDVILDAVHDYFDDEVTYSYKKDIPAAKNTGIGAAPTMKQSAPKPYTLLAIALIFWGITR
jgi:transglutaminase-like putative cysteine protease